MKELIPYTLAVSPLVRLTDAQREALVKAVAFLGRVGRLPLPSELAALFGTVPSAGRSRLLGLAEAGLLTLRGKKPPVLTPEGVEAARLLWDLGFVPEEDRRDYARALKLLGRWREENGRVGTAAVG